MATNSLVLSLSGSGSKIFPLRSGIIIRKGILDEGTLSGVSGDGYLAMESGTTYRSSFVTSVFPGLTDFDRYSITQGTFEMAGAGNQALNNLPSSIKSLKISGSGTKTLSESIVVDNSLEISGGTFDIGGFRVTGTGGLTMTGGTLKMGYSGAAIYPELTGAYSLTGGTIELNGTTGSGGSQKLRTSSFLSPSIIYNNLIINASEANFTTQNVEVEGPFQVTGNLDVFYPAVFYLGSSQVVSGTGSFILNPLACLKFEEKNGLTPTACGTGTTCGQIRTASRTFSTDGRYWVTGNQNGMVTGSGMPSSVHTLMVNRTGTNPVSLSNDIAVKYFLGVQNSGMLETGTKKITLADTAIIFEEEDAHVIGKVETTHNLGLTNDDFKGLGIQIDADGAAPGPTLVTRYTGVTVSGGAGQAINRKFSITPTTNAGLNATVVMKYFEDEINGLDENNFQLYRSTDGGITWVQQSGTPSIDENLITQTGINAFSEWTVGDVNVPLPVSILSFTGEVAKSKADLFWVTSSERGNRGFEIMRSVDGHHFQSIGFVQSQGNAEHAQSYSFSDFSFDQSYFYQLLQLSEDGKQVPSKIIHLDCNCGNELKISIFPNPNSGKIAFLPNQQISNEEVFELELIGMDGRLLYSNHSNLKYLEVLLNGELPKLASGLYHINLFNGRYREGIRMRKF